MRRRIGDMLPTFIRTLFVITIVPIAQCASEYEYDPCLTKETCGECIQAPSCVWCFDASFGNWPRCFHPVRQGRFCREAFVWNPENAQFTLVNQNGPQISPQQVGLKLRIKEKNAVNFKYTHAVEAATHSSVEIRDNSTAWLQVTYHSTCNTSSSELPSNKCDGLKVGDEVTFRADVIATSCPENRKDWFQTFRIYPVGIDASLLVDVEVLCDCPCEREQHLLYEKASPQCEGQGTYKCGVCECYPPYSGKNCECSLPIGIIAVCKPDNPSTADCGEHGQCICGVCECDVRENPEEVFYGKFCECDNFSCPRDNGRLCSGPDRGECQCGMCECKPGWVGQACEISSSLNEQNMEVGEKTLLHREHVTAPLK